jgi:hypothetical protein
MKYLLLDHLGVLTQTINDKGEVNESIVNSLNKLVTNYGYKILFQSSNTLAGQLDLLERIRAACSKKGLSFPPVVGTAVRDLLNFASIKSSAPVITTHNGIKVASYGEKKEGKGDMREALAVMLNITDSDRAESIVLDDDERYTQQAAKEGYQTKYIGGPDGLTFDKALKEILKREGH